MKCATVALIGRPSSGKSTLLNTICERKVSITSSTPQTTRNAIRGIYTDQRGQLIFIDTPGYHMGNQTMNTRLRQTAYSSLLACDIVLYVVDPTKKPGQEEQAIIDLLHEHPFTLVIALNKQDIADASQMETAHAYVSSYFPHAPIVELSAKNDTQVDELLIELFKLALPGELLYPEETYTDQSIEFRISEIIREKAITMVSEELPHAIYVHIADLEYTSQPRSVWIRAFIIVEKESQKGIVVGHGGERIKIIRKSSFKEIKRLFPGSSLRLDLQVKVQPKWRKNQAILQRLLS